MNARALFPPPPPKPRRPSFLALALAGFLGSLALIGLALGLAARAPAAPAPAPQWDRVDGQASARIGDGCDPAWSRLDAAGRLAGLQRQADVDGDGLVVVLRPVAFKRFASADFLRLAAELDCAVAGPGQATPGVRFRSAIGGDDVVAFDGADLVAARRHGLARPAA